MDIALGEGVIAHREPRLATTPWSGVVANTVPWRRSGMSPPPDVAAFQIHVFARGPGARIYAVERAERSPWGG